MIVDTLKNAEAHAGLHPGFARAFEFLRALPPDGLPHGRHEIEGSRVFALAAEDQGRGMEGARLEAHRKYVDIQFVVAGQERIGWRKLEECREVAEPYHEERDIGFFRDAPASWVVVPPGSFAIFFPEDAHAPLAGRGPVRKVVVKVAVG